MKQWVKKLAEQFDLDWSAKEQAKESPQQMSEDRATLLYILDTFNKHLFEIDAHPIRKVRETLDEFTKILIHSDPGVTEKTLFRLRQFFSSYRIAESTYIQKTFEDFKSIIWDFADQLSEDLRMERAQDQEIRDNLRDLREAVESNSMDILRNKSREFIDFYVEQQTKKDKYKTKRIEAVQQNLKTIKKQLLEANQTMRTDHLSGAFNRKSFDEQLKRHWTMSGATQGAVTLIVLDIDHFKKINDTYGHHVGDFVIKECVRLLKEIFHRDNDFVARIGGEEFAVILPDYRAEQALIKANEALEHIKKDVLVHSDRELRFTVSMGLAQLQNNESCEDWQKRADAALYVSKNSGRCRVTVAQGKPGIVQVA